MRGTGGTTSAIATIARRAVPAVATIARRAVPAVAAIARRAVPAVAAIARRAVSTIAAIARRAVSTIATIARRAPRVAAWWAATIRGAPIGPPTLWTPATALLGLVDPDGSAINSSAIHGRQGGPHALLAGEGHKAEAPRSTGIPVLDDHCIPNLTVCGKRLAKSVIIRAPAQSTDEKLSTHLFCSLLAQACAARVMVGRRSGPSHALAPRLAQLADPCQKIQPGSCAKRAQPAL